ncbi:hypothetical protein, partial [Bradyrhizobium brasilense]|uniref:hypothetical protein n=1 Tax=Bradyrhizobium brasilense TaxID=1419277 RepID=UPI001AEEB33D
CPLRTGITPSPRAGSVNHPDRAIQSIPRKSSPGASDPLVTLTNGARIRVEPGVELATLSVVLSALREIR